VLKVWITIENWPFSVISNTLVIVLRSSSNSKTSENSYWIGTGNNLIWLRVTTGSTSLYPKIKTQKKEKILQKLILQHKSYFKKRAYYFITHY
jgi:hypothetical protein